jgi:hypothetical protein
MEVNMDTQATDLRLDNARFTDYPSPNADRPPYREPTALRIDLYQYFSRSTDFNRAPRLPPLLEISAPDGRVILSVEKSLDCRLSPIEKGVGNRVPWMSSD